MKHVLIMTAAIAIPIGFLLLNNIVQKQKTTELLEQTMQEEPASQPELQSTRPVYTDNVPSDFRGISRGEGMSIHWGVENGDGARPLDAVRATIERIKFEQESGVLATDQNAQALGHLLLAKQALEGKATSTSDGLPIFE